MLATLQLPLPPSVNSYWNSFRGRVILSKKGKDYKTTIQEYVALHKVPSFGSARLQAIVTIFPKDRRKIDIDNRLKGLLDSLQDAGVFDDDEQFDLIQIARGKIKPGGGCTIVINELTE